MVHIGKLFLAAILASVPFNIGAQALFPMGYWSQVDPYFANVILLMHMDGADNSTTFTDVKGTVMTAEGSAKITSAQSKFGGASAIFSGSNSSVFTEAKASLVMGGGDFTIEYWVRGGNDQVSDYPMVVGTRGSFVANSWASNFAHVEISGRAGFNRYIGSGAAVLLSSGVNIKDSAWHFVAVVRKGDVFTFFLDGVLKATSTRAGTIDGSATRRLTIGGDTTSSGVNFKGYIDELRITKGVARYSANFTPPTAPFPDR